MWEVRILYYILISAVISSFCSIPICSEWGGGGHMTQGLGTFPKFRLLWIPSS